MIQERTKKSNIRIKINTVDSADLGYKNSILVTEKSTKTAMQEMTKILIDEEIRTTTEGDLINSNLKDIKDWLN